jgi:hypothetical protein
MKVDPKIKVVHLLVSKDWTPETLSSLGSGFIYHLSYPVARIEPELLAEIRAGLLPAGLEMEIVFRKGNQLRRVALAELEKVTDFETFIRLEFRLMQTLPSLKEIYFSPPNGYLFYYKKNPSFDDSLS